MSASAPLLGLSRHDEFSATPISVASGGSFAFERPAIVVGPTGDRLYKASAASAASTSKGRGRSITTRCTNAVPSMPRHVGGASPPIGLEDATWSQWFSNEIAKRCAVSEKTVEGIAVADSVRKHIFELRPLIAALLPGAIQSLR
jgi:hypothetical protein